jgi:hypothetical protein
MATNFPTSLDTFTNPNSGNTLDSPSHSIQHSDINDAVEAIEAKIGVGSSTAGSATAGYALVNTSGGTTAYSLLGVSGLSSGTAVANTFLTANGSGAATFAPTAQGLTLLIPSSVVVGSGSGSVSATGTVTFSGASSVSINDVFSATYDNYRIVFTGIASTGAGVHIRLRAAGTDNSTASSYVRQIVDASASSITTSRSTDNKWDTAGITSGLVAGYFYEMIDPFKASATGYILASIRNDGNAFFNPSAGTHNQTVSYDGFSLIASTGTFTGSVSVYGYNK